MVNASATLDCTAVLFQWHFRYFSKAEIFFFLKEKKKATTNKKKSKDFHGRNEYVRHSEHVEEAKFRTEQNYQF
jgi:hypothetical protein